ncbi:MAG: sorting protein [Akkermansiaceae bacterium]|nr:sorting protein [Akkermansiaceae bacterium]
MSPLARLSLALLATLLPLGAQTLVYSQPVVGGASFPYLLVSQGTEYGSAIRLSGTDRDVQSATVAVYSDVARTATITLSLYAAIPEDRGYPPTGSISPLTGLRPADTPLWTSGPLNLSLASDGPTNQALNQLIFSGINTLVPTDIFWAITFSNVTSSASGNFGPKFGDPANASPTGALNDPGQLYQRDPDTSNGDWVPSTLFDQGGNVPNESLGFALTAVPEPSVPVLVAGITVFGFIGRRRRA